MKTIDALLTEAVQAYNSQQLERVASICSDILKIDSRNGQAIYLSGLAHLAGGQSQIAAELIAEAIRLTSHDAQWYYTLGFAFESHGCNREAKTNFLKSVQLRPDFVDGYIHLAQVCLHEGEFDEAIRAYQSALSIDSASLEARHGLRSVGEKLIEHADSLLAPRGALSAVVGSLAQKRKIPILFNAIDCSAGRFVAEELRLGLELPLRNRITNEIREDCTIVADWLKDLILKGGLAHGHVDPRIENLILLHELGLRKFVVHVRDPRQILISAMRWHDSHYRSSQEKGDMIAVRLYHAMHSKEYFDLSDSEKIDRVIESRLPYLIHFIQDWFAAANDKKWEFDILFTTFEHFKLNRQQFYERICDFYAVPFDELTITPEEEVERSHYFRQGKLDEWRSIVSKDQYQRMMDKIPSTFFDTFGWRE